MRGAGGVGRYERINASHLHLHVRTRRRAKKFGTTFVTAFKYVKYVVNSVFEAAHMSSLTKCMKTLPLLACWPECVRQTKGVRRTVSGNFTIVEHCSGAVPQ